MQCQWQTRSHLQYYSKHLMHRPAPVLVAGRTTSSAQHSTDPRRSSMERSRKIFRKIASASYRIVAVANDYADREDSNGIPRCHFQLEEDMRRISVACECLAAILDKPPSEQGPAVDVRIQDWLNTDGPQECLRTLDRMENLLQQDTSFLTLPRIFRRGRGSTATQDKIKGAVDLFNSCKGWFHFLFSTEIW